jgi:ubiquinone/menaquinone biosynthesis C-methylase UbiE
MPVSGSNIKYQEFFLAKKAYATKKNITKLLRDKNIGQNNSEIIEIVYDLQAGSYIEYAVKFYNSINSYSSQLAKILDHYLSSKKIVLDVGTGELTTLSFVIKKLINKPKNIYAFDISLSRILKGLNFAKKNMGNDFLNLTTFVGDIKEIPLQNKSVDITTSSHALEPNGGNLHLLMLEIFRVTKDKLILFEPCYEINSKKGKKRMDKLGYIKNIEGIVNELNGKVLDKIIIKNPINSLNPTVCFVISPPPPKSTNVMELKNLNKKNIFTVPGTNFNINKKENFYYSNDTGLCFPIIKSIPILKSNIAILASCLQD